LFAICQAFSHKTSIEAQITEAHKEGLILGMMVHTLKMDIVWYLDQFQNTREILKENLG
jgi:hypothetical protein